MEKIVEGCSYSPAMAESRGILAIKGYSAHFAHQNSLFVMISYNIFDYNAKPV